MNSKIILAAIAALAASTATLPAHADQIRGAIGGGAVHPPLGGHGQTLGRGFLQEVSSIRYYNTGNVPQRTVPQQKK